MIKSIDDRKHFTPEEISAVRVLADSLRASWFDATKEHKVVEFEFQRRLKEYTVMIFKDRIGRRFKYRVVVAGSDTGKDNQGFYFEDTLSFPVLHENISLLINTLNEAFKDEFPLNKPKLRWGIVWNWIKERVAIYFQNRYN